MHNTSAPESFAGRHIGPSADEIGKMLRVVGFESLEELVDAAIPGQIRLRRPLSLPAAATETEALARLRAIMSKNKLCRTYIGMGYYNCITPPVIQRNILENPGWYTAYTPYQAEISQGRLEALLNFQTMVTDLTGLEIANASLLDEATAAAEAMTMAHRLDSAKRSSFLVSPDCHPQTIHVVRTRARPLGIRIEIGEQPTPDTFGILLQYPASDGAIRDLTGPIRAAHAQNALAVVATDLLALTLIPPPGEFGADIAVGSTQRFGMPLGFGGPHAAFLATRDAFKRQMPGRLIGVSRDAEGRPALRMALQTREQHIRREKATSNICTSQVLPAVVASMYAVWHGPHGLKRIARRIHQLTRRLAENVQRVGNAPFFDTLRVRATPPPDINVRNFGDGTIGISLDETTTEEDVETLIRLLGPARAPAAPPPPLPQRTSAFLTHPVFNSYHTETEMLRYIKRLEWRDLSLAHSMIPLGSCTMKLNATAEMIPLAWPEVSNIHPFAPEEQTAGYRELFSQLEQWLAEITGLPAVSLQPNAGSQGEYAGLLAIRAWHQHRGQPQRNICLIPVSAHGTNPASAVLAGLRVVPVGCDAAGNIDIEDLRAKAGLHRDTLAALMVTYPSTHGVFEPRIAEICQIVHEHGGQVYLDGANMNAMVGLCRPGDFGADVCHLNLHKTFCIPHGGGGPGMGPIAVAAHLAPFLPGHPLGNGNGPVSAAPWGSASLLTISWMYIAMMGADALTLASKVAILSANYIARRLAKHFPVLFKGTRDLVGHECIVGLPQHNTAGVTVEDVAKRLIDYGFHAPTMSWPVPGTLMIEPTESESKAELDRFCDAMIAIAGEIESMPELLKNAPHTALALAGEWTRPYSRRQAAFPAPWTRERKFWPAVARVDNVYGDRNLCCSCPPVTTGEG
jgi:glycine dehydrogenase